MNISLRILFWSPVSTFTAGLNSFDCDSSFVFSFNSLFNSYVTFGPDIFLCANCLSFILFVDLVVRPSTETWIFVDKMKKNHIHLFTPSLFTSSIYEIIYATLFKDYRTILRRFSRVAILVQMLRFRDKTKKLRTISYILNWTHHRILY